MRLSPTLTGLSVSLTLAFSIVTPAAAHYEWNSSAGSQNHYNQINWTKPTTRTNRTHTSPSTSTYSPANGYWDSNGVWHSYSRTSPSTNMYSPLNGYWNSDGSWHPYTQTYQTYVTTPIFRATIRNYGFLPNVITVKRGTMVAWTNEDRTEHTVKGDNFDMTSVSLAQGQSASHVFNRTGTFTYYCQLHPEMRGTVVVVP